jgi:two-component system, NarL family, invasion response regulator UvrY
MRVLIVDDHRIVASGCRALFGDDPGIVILEASDAESGERSFIDEHPDVCVLDINLPTVSGYELARRILAHDAAARIIMFSMNDDPIFAARAIEVGAKGYVSKTGDPCDLVEAIREVGKGGTYLPPAMAQSIAFAGPTFAQNPL